MIPTHHKWIFDFLGFVMLGDIPRSGGYDILVVFTVRTRSGIYYPQYKRIKNKGGS
jgi:hypothetical protein